MKPRRLVGKRIEEDLTALEERYSNVLGCVGTFVLGPHPVAREYVDRAGTSAGSFVNDYLVTDSIIWSCVYCRAQPEDHAHKQCLFLSSWYTPYGEDRARDLAQRLLDAHESSI